MTWDGRNNHDTATPSGVCFVVLNTSKGRFTTKLLLMK